MLAFDLHGDAWDPFGYGQQYLAYHMSVKFNIPLIFFGENGEIEYGGEEKHKNMVEAPMEDWEEIFYKGSGPQKLIDAGLKRNLQNNMQMISRDFSALTNSLKLPYDLINFNKSKVKGFSKNLHSLVRRDFVSGSEKYNYYIKLIETNSIQSNLKKGYSIISKNKKIINKSKDIKENDTLSATLMDRTIEIKIKKIN